MRAAFYNMGQVRGVERPARVEKEMTTSAAIRTPEAAAKFEAVCAACQWNVDWICEHAGCRPCKQRAAGGLKAMILKANFHCPAGKVQN